MKLSKNYFFLAIPIIIFVVFLLLPQTRPLFLSRATQEAIARREKIFDTWRSANYTKIEHSDDFEAKIRETVRQHEAARSLTAAQRQALAKAITQLIYAHHDGTWESYRAFRIPVNSKYAVFDPKLLSLYKSELPSSRAEFMEAIEIGNQHPLAKKYKSKYPNIAEDDALWIEENIASFDVSSPIAIYETYWRFNVRQMYTLDGKSANCTRCWRSLALENMQLNVHSIPEGHSDPKIAMFQLSTNSITSSISPGSSLSFRPSLDELLAKGPAKATSLSLLIRDDRDENPYPVHVDYYWAPRHGKWLPVNLFLIGRGSDSIHYFF